MDYSTWLPKDEAARALGVAPKTLERWAQGGKLQQASWCPQGRGPARVVYHPADVERLAQERRVAPAPFVLPAAPDVDAPIVGGNGHGGAELALTAGVGDDPLRALFGAALRAVLSQTSETSGPPALFLTVPEAAALTGLSQAYLRRLHADGTLPGVRDRGLRFRRRDLEAL